jgi:hypothetical protein
MRSFSLDISNTDIDSLAPLALAIKKMKNLSQLSLNF